MPDKLIFGTMGRILLRLSLILILGGLFFFILA